MFSFFLWQQPPPPPQGGNPILTLLLWGGIFVIIYFMMIRGPKKRREEELKLVKSFKKGQKVVTIGGIHGTIWDSDDLTFTLLIAPKTYIRVQKDCISPEYTQAVYAVKNNSEDSETTPTVEHVPSNTESPQQGKNL